MPMKKLWEKFCETFTLIQKK